MGSKRSLPRHRPLNRAQRPRHRIEAAVHRFPLVAETPRTHQHPVVRPVSEPMPIRLLSPRSPAPLPTKRHAAPTVGQQGPPLPTVLTPRPSRRPTRGAARGAGNDRPPSQPLGSPRAANLRRPSLRRPSLRRPNLKVPNPRAQSLLGAAANGPRRRQNRPRFLHLRPADTRNR